MSEQDHPTVDMPVVNAPVFEAPLPGADVARCPACLSPVRGDQRYCLECGERLLVDEIPPPPDGGSAFSNRSTTLLALVAVVLIVVGVGLAWVALREPTAGEDTTDTAITAPTDTVMTDTGLTDTGTSASGWPAGQTGWAVILASKSQSTFQESDAQLVADEAATAGVSMTGVLDSSLFPSLNPGYWAVFSGPYATREEADAAALTIQGQGYPDAYPREVQP